MIARCAAAVEFGPDAVVHLAAVASNPEALADPGLAWTVNAAGTARLAEALAMRRERGGGEGRLLVVSSGEVYGPGARVARKETDAVAPATPYAASKVGAELAGLEVWRRTGLPVIVSPVVHPHGAGAGRTVRAARSFAARLREARATGARRVRTGNLDPVRDLLDVRDVVEAYLLLLRSGEPGEIYNVARGEGASVGELFAHARRADRGLGGAGAGSRTGPQRPTFPTLSAIRPNCGAPPAGRPRAPCEQTLRGLVDAEAD